MRLITGTWRNCHWQFLHDVHETKVWDDYITHLLQLEPTLQKGDFILDLWFDCGRPTPTNRSDFTSKFMNARDLERIGGHAFVTNSVLSRGVLTAINWVVRRPFDEKPFARPDDGLAWLRERQPDFDVDGLQIQLRQRIDGFDRLRW